MSCKEVLIEVAQEWKLVDAKTTDVEAIRLTKKMAHTLHCFGALIGFAIYFQCGNGDFLTFQVN